MKYNKLTPEEERVIIHKGTERAFTGEYTDHKGTGTYICRQCNAPLYKSEDKFDSHCGWPSFEDEIPGAVKRVPDADGRRTEIICNNCGGHLGHVFLNEGFTDKNTRHCVNSISLKFIPNDAKAAMDKTTESATFAGGCFWGVEYYFQKQDGVLSTTVGYTGGTKDNPTYKEVCSGATGHVEAIQVEFDPDLVSYEDLTKLFFEIHDPTQVDRQGPDIGYQYRSMVFYHNEKQKAVSEKLIKILESKGYDVATKVVKAEKFWPAEDYHQEYYQNNGKQPYCHFYKKKF
ncbi:MAG: bifunctional methionine sulfoxide reductase B/A protein [Calditrichaceae bacterium]|nr:bifunctional methionine sulfoxide reductase B/A protein [Calditrichaceae bacterium]